MGPVGRLTCAILCVGSALVWWLGRTGADYADPARLEKAVRALEARDGRASKGGIVCVGSSSIAGWQPTAKIDLAPLPVVSRGLGGGTMNDVRHYAERLVVRHRPRAVVVYAGENELDDGVAPARVRDAFVAFARTVHAKLPEARIYVISLKPSPARWGLWPKMAYTNRLLKEACAADARLEFVSVAEGMLGPDGRARRELFLADGLHMNRRGYKVWRDAVRPRVLRHHAAVAEGVAPTAGSPAAAAPPTPGDAVVSPS